MVRGVMAALATAFDSDLNPDAKTTAAHGHWLLANGCDALCVLGTTGEANSLTVSERMTLLDGLLAAGLPAEKLLVGTGVCAGPDTVALTDHALGAGCGGVLMLPPFYYKGVTDDGLFSAYSRVIDGLTASDPHLYLYDFPKMTGAPLSHDLIARLISAYPQALKGMKDSSGDFESMAAVVRAHPDFAVFAGSDGLAGPLTEIGGAGCITSIANLTAPLLAKIVADPSDHETQKIIVAIREAFPLAGMIALVKALLARATGHDGWTRMRPPLVSGDPARVDQIAQAMTDAGYPLPEGTGR